jgi:RimJ/RimL family protein N-acetyltransferase
LRHDLHATGALFFLRPVVIEDAESIVEIRGDADRMSHVNAISGDPAEQRRWIERYFERDGDWYFAIGRNGSGRVEGFVGIYDLERSGSHTRAEWGRWVLGRASLAAPESALLIYRVAFETLGLDEVYCRTAVANAAVISFHDRCRLTSRELIPRGLPLNGTPVDAVRHTTLRKDAKGVEAALSPLAQRIAARFSKAP